MRKILIISLTFALFSCSSSSNLTQRYKSISVIEDKEMIDKNIEVNAYVLEKENNESSSKSIFNLSPEAQAAFIVELGKKESSTDKFFSGLQNNLSSTNLEIIDYSKFDKRIVFSIRNNSHFPADRIARINITTGIGNELKIVSCNKLITDYQSLDLANLNTIEAQDNASKPVLMNAVISQNKLSIYQESKSSVDLAGIVLADVTLEARDLKIERIYAFGNLTKNNSFTNPADILVNEKLIIYPNINKDIRAEITFEADFRQVKKGDKTISEADDVVKLYHGSVTKSVKEVIIPKTKLQPKFWKLTFNTDIYEMPILIKSPDMEDYINLVFNSFNEARDFANWLKAKFDDEKNEIVVGNLKYNIQMPDKFTSIKNIEVLPYQ